MTSEQRIERLELRCRVLMASLVGVVALGGVALFTGAAQKQANVVRADAVEITDAAGNVRIRLGKLDSPPTIDLFGLMMKDANGSQRVCIQDYAQLMLDRGDGRVSLGAGDQGASFQLSSKGLRPRAMITVTNDMADLQLRDSHGEVSWRQATPRIQVARDAKQADPFAK